MDRPNEGEASPQRMTRTEYSRNVRAAIEERRHKAMLNRQHYQPQIHEQIQRLFSEYDAPFYARLRGFGRTQTLALAEATVLGLAAGTDRNLSDTETQALTEHFLSSVHNMLAWKWIMTGLAGYLTYRGRQTMRFPFFKPVVAGGRFDPATGGPQVRIMWHTARFAAYYGAFWLIGEPIFQGFNFLRQSYSLDRDPRLGPLLRDGRKMADQALGGAAQDALGQQQQQQQQYNDAWKSTEYQEEQQQQHQSSENHQSTSQAVRAQTQQAWASYRRQPEPSQQSAPKAWDLTDDVDDASPIAPSARSATESTRSYSGSAWDRIRQQTHSPTQSHDGAQSQKTWEQRAQTNTNGAWVTDDDASPQYRGDKNTYSFSTTSDREDAAARRQAQKEFDELVERERGGADQERSSWGRR
ncbi:hypothetical protein E4U43_004965 [Claviceps pusilla]|uniref:Uncharacterized protein n=1 Tax=Claviceps pusilla TaxID=123648 RepID=A0A9P7NEZ3_9HYPO|nr:hypothetical protein E4U43_004965 [Claviceps pusilla]